MKHSKISHTPILCYAQHLDHTICHMPIGHKGNHRMTSPMTGVVKEWFNYNSFTSQKDLSVKGGKQVV